MKLTRRRELVVTWMRGQCASCSKKSMRVPSGAQLRGESTQDGSTPRDVIWTSFERNWTHPEAQTMEIPAKKDRDEVTRGKQGGRTRATVPEGPQCGVRNHGRATWSGSRSLCRAGVPEEPRLGLAWV